MIEIKREYEEYYIVKDKINYINTYKNDYNEYIINIFFYNSDNNIYITCDNESEYYYILKKIKEF